MTVLSGPLCADGYRWWQIRLGDGMTGWVADSDSTGWWIELAPAAPTEAINFWSDRYSITSGECVTLQWAMEGIREVYYQGSGSPEIPVTGSGTRTECPTTTTTYSMRVIKTDGTTTNPSITITVGSGGGDLPDLYVNEFALNPSIPIKGQPVQVRIGVYNKGTADITGTSFRVEWYPTEYFDVPACTWNINNMHAHGGQILHCDYAGYSSHYPSINTMVKVDFAGAIIESDKTNNTYKQTISVITP